MARKFQIKRGLKANLPTLAQGEFAMTTDSGAEVLWLGTGSKNRKIPLDPAAADVGAVRCSGDTMTGALSIKSNGKNLSMDTWGIGAVLIASEPDGSNMSGFVVDVNQNDEKHILRGHVKGVYCDIHHTGNKPGGSYTGNGSSARRTIDTGGIGNMLAVTSVNALALVTPAGAVQFNSTTSAVNYCPKTEINFTDGVLTISTASFLNANGGIYAYQVL